MCQSKVSPGESLLVPNISGGDEPRRGKSSQPVIGNNSHDITSSPVKPAHNDICAENPSSLVCRRGLLYKHGESEKRRAHTEAKDDADNVHLQRLGNLIFVPRRN